MDNPLKQSDLTWLYQKLGVEKHECGTDILKSGLDVVNFVDGPNRTRHYIQEAKEVFAILAAQMAAIGTNPCHIPCSDVRFITWLRFLPETNGDKRHSLTLTLCTSFTFWQSRDN